MTHGYQLDHLLSLRLIKPFFDNVLLEHGGLPHVLHHAVPFWIWGWDFGLGLGLGLVNYVNYLNTKYVFLQQRD